MLIRDFAILWVLLALLSPFRCQAFSLVGPYADWMTWELGYHELDDIGGPMQLEEEYRWNVPQVTYAFDRSFLDYFGSNGVAAVEQAIAMLNELPPASQIALSDYPLGGWRMNYRACAQGLEDLKSRTLAVLLHEMGLADPRRNMYCLRKWDSVLTNFCCYHSVHETNWPPGITPEIILKRNYDPLTLAATNTINGATFVTQSQWESMDPKSGVPRRAYMGIFSVDLGYEQPPLTEFVWGFFPASVGVFASTLTRDDIGGLRYLYSATNVNFESLLEDVHGIGVASNSFVKWALRPGIEKLTFVRQDYDALLDRAYAPLTNQYLDSFIVNGQLHTQPVERVVTEPDFVFSVAEVEDSDAVPRLQLLNWTGTTNWLKTTTSETALGPGIIRPRIFLRYYGLSPSVESEVLFIGVDDRRWGSFDGRTNAPIVYRGPVTGTNEPLAVNLIVLAPDKESLREIFRYGWSVPVGVGSNVSLQISSDLVNWSATQISNTPGRMTWRHFPRPGYPEEKQFFRVIAE